jgi:hypothetical protein
MVRKFYRQLCTTCGNILHFNRQFIWEPQKIHFYYERLQSPPSALSGQNVSSRKLSAMPAAILTFRLDGENFARSRYKSNFWRLPYIENDR